LHCFEKAALMENVEAYTLLGMYFNSENNNIKKDYQKAKDYLEKAANKNYYRA
jgi:TPR repeat protein